MNKSYLKLLPYIAIMLAGILFIPYDHYYTCQNACSADGLCTQMYCPPHALNIIKAVGINADVHMPNAAQFTLIFFKSIGAAITVYATSLLVNRFIPQSGKKKR